MAGPPGFEPLNLLHSKPVVAWQINAAVDL
jgi:hypothetical protein